MNPALELRTGWGSSTRRRVVIPSIPQVLRLAEALDHFKPGLGDVAMVLAFTGLRWEEAVAIPIENVDLDGQWIKVDRTASESGGKRDVRVDLKTRAAERVAAIPDIAMPAVRMTPMREIGFTVVTVSLPMGLGQSLATMLTSQNARCASDLLL